MPSWSRRGLALALPPILEGRRRCVEVLSQLVEFPVAVGDVDVRYEEMQAECVAYGYECFASDDAHYVGPHGPMANRTARVPDPTFSPQQCTADERTAGTCRPSVIDVPLCPSCLPHWSRRRALAARPYAWSPGVYQRNRWVADGLQWVSRGAASKAVT